MRLLAVLIILVNSANAAVISVGESNSDFSNIEEAINAAQAGDIILINSGGYYGEDYARDKDYEGYPDYLKYIKDRRMSYSYSDRGKVIDIDKQITLLGYDGIERDISSEVDHRPAFIKYLRLKEDGILIQGLHIEWLELLSDNNIIRDIRTSSILLGESDNNIIENVEINISQYGILLYKSGHNTLRDNRITDTMRGVSLIESNDNVIENNYVNESDHNAFYINNSSDNIIIYNDISYTDKMNDAILVEGESNNNLIQHNDFVFNQGLTLYLKARTVDNLIQFNNFIYNSPAGHYQTQVYDESISNNWAHNYYLDRDLTASNQQAYKIACKKESDNPICDSAYFINFEGVIDKSPSKIPNFNYI